MIHIALAFHDNDGNYALHAAATLVSLFRRTASPITAHILHDAGLNDTGRARLAAVAEHFGQGLRLHAVPELPPASAADLPPQFGPGSLYRLHLPALVDEEQVIYLDCDICCTLDIRELWEQAAQGRAPSGEAPLLSCVRNMTDGRAVEKKGLNPAWYFNSGVLVFRPRRLRAVFPDLMAAVLRLLPELPRPLLFPDQDALNVIFRRLPLHWLDERFNYQLHVAGRWLQPPDLLEGKVLHFCGHKPWCEPLFPSALGNLENYRFLRRLLTAPRSPAT